MLNGAGKKTIERFKGWSALGTWQILALAVPCGVFAANNFLCGSLAFIFILLMSSWFKNCEEFLLQRFKAKIKLSPFENKQTRQNAPAKLLIFQSFIKILLALILFCLAFFIMQAKLKAIENNDAFSLPAWAQPLLNPELNEFSQGSELVFKIDSIDGLYGGRLRLIISELCPASSSIESIKKINHSEKLEGKAVWVLQNKLAVFGELEPLANQYYRAKLRLRKQEGFRNSKLSNSDDYWAQRGVFYRILPAKPSVNLSLLEEQSLAQLNSDNYCVFFELEKAMSATRQALLLKITQALRPQDSETHGIIYALISGDRQFVSQKTADLFVRSSLIHSLALSGTHLGVVVLLSTIFVSLFARFYPQVYLTIPRLSLIALSSVPLAMIYLWIGDFTPSLLRAALMLFVGAWSLVIGRLRKAEDALILAVLIISIFDPWLLFNLSLQLSVAAVAIIILAVPLHSFLIAKTLLLSKNKLVRLCLKSFLAVLLVSFSVQFLLMPISIFYFGVYPLFFLLNVLWVPVLGVLVLPLSFLALCLASLSYVNLAGLCFDFAAVPIDFLLSTLVYLDKNGVLASPVALRPLPAAVFACIGLIFSTIIFWRYRKLGEQLNFSKKVAFIICAGMMFYPVLARYYPDNQPSFRVSALDVGQGQALLIESFGKRLLCDGGGLASESFDVGRGIVAPSLTYNAAPRLDYVVNTHPDNDHLKGLLYILDKFKVAQVGFSLLPSDNNLQEQLADILAAENFIIELWRKNKRILWSENANNKYYIEVLHPADDLTLKNHNDHSLSLRFIRSDSQGREHGLLLILGDLQQVGINYLLRSKQNLQADLLILPHHGSVSSLSVELYKQVSPKLAIASAGRNNSWGFPSAQVRAALVELGIPLRSTSEEGEIIIDLE